MQTNADGRGIHFTILDASAPTWNAEIDRFGVDFDASNNPAVFPYHFLQAVLPRIGGRIVLFGRGAERIGVGFLFPRGLTHASQSTATATERIFTLRYHILDPAIPHLSDRFLDDIGQALGGAQVVGYDPNAPQEYAATHQWFDGVDVGCQIARRPKRFDIFISKSGPAHPSFFIPPTCTAWALGRARLWSRAWTATWLAS